MKTLLTLGTLLALAAGGAAAEPYRAGDLTVRDPWARASVGQARTGAGYLTITNGGGVPDRLTAVAAPDAASKAELHTHIQEGDVMRMRQVPAIEVPPGGTVELKPGGLHVMLMGLSQPLRAGERVKATLSFERAGDVPVEFDVLTGPPGSAPAGHTH